MAQKASQEYEPYLHIFWECVKSECISICKTSTKIDHLSEGNIKGAGLPIDIYLTLRRKYTLARAFGKEMYLICHHKKRQRMQSQGVFVDRTFVVPEFGQLEKKCSIQV